MPSPRSTVSFGRAQPPATPAVAPSEPYVYREYPRMLYCHGHAPCIVQSDQERATLSGDWAETLEAAEAIYARQQELIANAAAERAWSDQKLSAKARAEKLKAERATDAHVPE